MKFVRKALVASGLLLAGLAAVLGGKSALTKSRQVAVVPAAVAAMSESEQQQAAHAVRTALAQLTGGDLPAVGAGLDGHQANTKC